MSWKYASTFGTELTTALWGTVGCQVVAAPLAVATCFASRSQLYQVWLASKVVLSISAILMFPCFASFCMSWLFPLSPKYCHPSASEVYTQYSVRNAHGINYVLDLCPWYISPEFGKFWASVVNPFLAKYEPFSAVPAPILDINIHSIDSSELSGFHWQCEGAC